MEFDWFGPEPRSYRDPLATIEAFTRSETGAALRRADDALAAGYSIAGFVAYEAGYAERPVADEPTTDEPLIALGVFAGPRPLEALDADREDAAFGPLVAQIERARYEADLAAIASALHAGDAYQVNYTVPFRCTYAGPARAVAATLRARARVPYAAFVQHRERAVVSLSPELFFTIDGDAIETRPMKGTSPPDGTAGLGDAKNRAEHVMIVDLLRNDLHRICDVVDVAALMSVEAYPTFATMTSTIAGRLTPGRTLGDCFAALFPCGSITGAPKRSAMATIARLEAASRGVAMGAIGYCDAPRRGMWNVAIRTAVLDERTRTAEIRIGGGIVADSEPGGEWAEIAIKRRIFASLTTRVGVFETLALATDGRLVRADAHLERMAASAFAFGIPFDARAARRMLEAASGSGGGRAMLVRLALDEGGALTIGTRPLVAAPSDARAYLTGVRLDANDPTLRHKTDARASYDAAARAAAVAGAFDGLLTNQYGTLADGARTTIFLEDDDGRFAIPPLRDGALAGILRAELLRDGRAYEASLRPGELAGRRLWLGNSARGLVAVRLAGSPVSA